jgi:hypothetical protein
MRSTICFLKFLLAVLVVTTFCAKPPLPPLPQLRHHHHYLKHFPFSFCRTIDAQDEYNFVSRMYVTVFLPLISAARSLTSPQKSFVQSQWHRLACCHRWRVEDRSLHDNACALRAGANLGLSHKAGGFRFFLDDDDYADHIVGKS